VLVPILAPDWIIYTLRAADLGDHAAQVSFPGGKPEPGDTSPLATALRETEEELGLEAPAFEAIGRLDATPTPSGFLITPHVALWSRPELPQLAPASREVESVVVVPLSTLAEPNRHRERLIPWQGRELISHEYHVPEHQRPDGTTQGPARIWGATGRMTHQLLQLSCQTE
jgi:8-oxo-dGTP pyrophosphatase MutT (NUDIX family)